MLTRTTVVTTAALALITGYTSSAGSVATLASMAGNGTSCETGGA